MGMRLTELTRKAKKRLIPEEGDICKLLFARRKTQRVCRLFLNWLKKRGGRCTRSELSQFASDLQAGKIAKDFTYQRRSFYRQIRRPLLDLGLINLEPWFGYKYVFVRQPIPKRPPDTWSFWRLAWMICKRWNEEFEC